MVDMIYEAYKEAEIGLLGSILVDSDCCLNEILLDVKDEDFLTTYAKALWKVIVELKNESMPVDMYTVKSRSPAEYEKLIDDIYIVTPTAANWSAYLSELKRHSKLYKAKEIAQVIVDEATAGTVEISYIRQQSEQLITVLESSDARKTDYTMKEMSRTFLDNMEMPKNYLDFGMPSINQCVLCEPGDYVLIGATPSTGKTALTLQLAVNIARKGKRVLYFSFETTQEKIMDRIISCQGRVSFTTIKRRDFTKEQISACVRTAREVYNLPFNVIESAGMTIEDIRAKAIKYEADVIFIDYIQQVAHRNEKLTEYQRITEISKGIQQICKKYKIITIANSQFSRLNGSRPTLHSFRSSGQLEQDADIAFLLYRPGGVEEGEDDTKRILEIAKIKDGKVGKLKMFFDGDHQTFTVEDFRR